MIYGKVINGKVIIPVVFRLPSQPAFSLDFVIDTGFNDLRLKGATSRFKGSTPRFKDAINRRLYNN
ncbi:hypothetical protein [Nostoc sp. CALU 546]|uniref:hypothetical protein n=1 Tax=Nostoc sp. CALU 546 TaxID=1867241 RepID=UPI003B6756BE